MSDAFLVDVREQVAAMVRNLSKLTERQPDAVVQGDEFNAFLDRIRQVFSGNAAIRDVKKIEKVTTLADLMIKLSIIEGTLEAEIKNRNYAAAEAARKRLRSNAGTLGDVR